MAISKQIQLPIGFRFWLQNKKSGERIEAPAAFQGYDWRAWPKIPDGIEYQIEEVVLPQNWEYTVGPACRVIRWDSIIWEADESAWAGTAWQVEEVA